MEAMSRPALPSRRLALVLIVGAALVGTPAGGAAFASSEGSPGETGSSPTAGCPSSNPPNEMTLVAGTPQTALLGSAFATALQVALSNSDGCPVSSAAAGIPVTFSAPAAGASGTFSSSGSDTAVVGADASGAVAAPAFTANSLAGTYTLTASSQYGSVSFSLTNTATGIPARILAIALQSRSASVTGRYTEPLQARVLDADGNPVAGATVTFTLDAGAVSACATSSSQGAGATFAAAGTQASSSSDASGVASSPVLTANSTVGSFTATAALAGREPTAGSGRENPGASEGGAAAPVRFSLSNLAGRPAKLTPGVGATQSTDVGTPFRIPLALTVTDAQKNPVAGALVTFSAPAAGAGGRFTLRVRDRHRRVRVIHPRTVEVRTGACGIAVAPPFTAGATQGGYVVEASAGHARAAFALVNQAPGR